MTDGFDLSGLDNLAADLDSVGREVVPFAARAVGMTSNKIKKSWQGKVSGSRALPGLANAVSYDVTAHAAAVEAEIGYDRSKYQGNLGVISEFGSPTHAPRGYGIQSLHENTADFVHGIERAVEDALKKRGL